MSRVLKFLLIAVAAIVGIGIVAAIAFLMFFDPNDFRDDISAQVSEATGREFVIEGDLSVSLFPWLAVEVGRSELGNAEGFGAEPFASFDQARLSVRLLPLLFRQEVAVGTATLDALNLNLQVAANGANNWEDLATAGDDLPDAETMPEEDSAAPAALDIANVRITNASISYRDAQAGSAYTISALTLETDRIAMGEPFGLDAGFDFTAEPGELGGRLEIDGTVTLGEAFASLLLDDLTVAGEMRGLTAEPTDLRLGARSIAVDTDAETASMGEIDLDALGLSVTALVEPFSYAGDLAVQANIRVLPFSLKDLMQTLGSELPVTADPAALTRVAFAANAAISDTAARLTNLSLNLDDTTLTGQLSVPLTEDGRLEFTLAADSIDLDRYMAPADAAAAESGSTDDIEIPVDLIRALKARGTVTLERATLAGMLFEDLEVGLDSADGRLRMHPISARLFEGTYSGDVRIDATTATPSISVNEKIADVSLTPLAQAMFEQENISGTISGAFALSGRGQNLAQIRSDLDGTMAFALEDGAWEGTDVWYQLRSARALFKQESPPERRNPPRTEFSSVIATGTVTDGVFRNDDLLAELPFLQLTGNGTVNLVKVEVDYGMQARVLERPEFATAATDSELADFTEAVIPLRISGPLASPSVRPDIDGMLRAEVKKVVEEKRDELRDRLVNRLLGGDKAEAEAAGAAEATETGEPGDVPEEEEKDAEDQLKDSLRRLFDQ
ncbi:MAG: AsmA family protein [Woeseia sp.]